jgi:hypothetical protein
LLSCIPCSDSDITTGAGVTTIVKSTAAADSHAHTDTCSPFCICACCATYPVQSEPIVYSLYHPDLAVTHTAFYFSLVQKFPYAVWQPPQLS